MKLGGYRTDGTLRVLIPGGMTIILRGDLASPPLDDQQADALGPWIEPHVALTWNERQELAKRLDRSRVVPANTFRTFALAEEPAWISDDDDKEEDEPADDEAADTPDEEADEPADEPADDAPAKKAAPPFAKKDPADEPAAPASADDAAKGDLLAQIKKIADAREKEKAVQAAKKLPRFGKKRLKLEYEVEDREGEEAPKPKDDDEKKPPFGDEKKSPFDEKQSPFIEAAHVPDHLQPMEKRS